MDSNKVPRTIRLLQRAEGYLELQLPDRAIGELNSIADAGPFEPAVALLRGEALISQARGLIGTQGILPAAAYLNAGRYLGAMRFWYIPTLLWFSRSDHMLMAICWLGLSAAILLAINVWPRAALLVCFALALSALTALGMLYQLLGQVCGLGLLAGTLTVMLRPGGSGRRGGN